MSLEGINVVLRGPQLVPIHCVASGLVMLLFCPRTPILWGHLPELGIQWHALEPAEL